MAELPDDLRYTQSHEWVRIGEDGTVIVGITDHAQNLLGDVVFVELPESESVLKAGNECAVIESVKAAADVYCPLNGEVIEVNEELLETPALVNSDPYGEGWLFVLKLDDESDMAALMDADQYQSSIEE